MNANKESSIPLIGHLTEVRQFLMKTLLMIALLFFGLMYFANDIYHIIAAPLIRNLPAGASMIATDVSSPFFTPIKLKAMLAVVLSIPFILYQVWAFVAPGLYQNEKRLVMPLMAASSLCFKAGTALCLFHCFPSGI